MENNQHSNGQNASKENSLENPFTNQQPGQQLPTDASNIDAATTQTAGAEQHSESSKPENANETLGTP